ncbi:IS3 family transposase [Legionella sainthelensi]
MIYGVSYKTRKEAQLALFDYIEVFYNRQRIHSSLGFQTPNDFGMVA